MQRNWKLLQEILLFLSRTEQGKCSIIGESYSSPYIPERYQRKTILIFDGSWQKYFEIEKSFIHYQKNTIELRKQIMFYLETSNANGWEDEDVEQHLKLLSDVGAIEETIETVEEDIDPQKWEEGYYHYADYDEILYSEIDETVGDKGYYHDVTFYRITWLGFDMLDILDQMEKDNINLKILKPPHPILEEKLIPLIQNPPKKKRATRKKRTKPLLP